MGDDEAASVSRAEISDSTPLLADSDEAFTSYDTTRTATATTSSSTLDRRRRASSPKHGGGDAVADPEADAVAEAEASTEAEEMSDIPMPLREEPQPLPGHENDSQSRDRGRRRPTGTWPVYLWSKVHDLIPIEPSLLLENNGSVARDHLASERTFLAYVRTSLAVASTGVALVQLFSIAAAADENGGQTAGSKRIQQFARPLGAITIIFGLFLLSMGMFRYFLIQHHLTMGNFPAARFSVYIMAFGLGAMVVAVFGVLVAIPRGIS